MKKWKKIITTITLTLAILVSLAGCSQKSDKSANTKSTEKKHLNIALQPVPGYVPVYLLKDNASLKNALKDYNVEINFTEFEAGPPENESFASGQQDVGVMGNVPGIAGIAAGQKRSIIGIAYNGEKTEVILVSKDSDIQSVKDLKGKKIGLVVGSIAQNLLYLKLQQEGLTLEDVELVNLSTGEQESTLATKKVDAIVTWEPTITKLKNNISARVLADGTGIFLGENPIVANKEYVEENPEIVKIFLKEYEKVAKEVKGNPEKTADKYADKFGLSKEEFISALKNAEFPVAITKEDTKDLQGTADFLYKSKIISTKLAIEDSVVYEVDKK